MSVETAFVLTIQHILLDILRAYIPDQRIMWLCARVIGSFSSTAQGNSRAQLESLLSRIATFLHETLKLDLHPDKVWIQTVASGVDFLGWIHFHDHRVMRTSTKRRMFRRIAEHGTPEAFASYRGLLRHGNARGIASNFGV